MRSRKTLVLLLIALVPAVAGVLCFLIETDAEAIERIVEDCRRAFLAGDVDRILAFVADDATAAGWVGEGPLAPRVKEWVDRNSRRLTGLTVRRREIVVEGDAARSDWIVTVTTRHGGGLGLPRFQVRIAAEFHRGPDGFKVRRAEATAP